MIPWDRNRAAYDSVLEAIGRNPLLRLRAVRHHSYTAAQLDQYQPGWQIIE